MKRIEKIFEESAEILTNPFFNLEVKGDQYSSLNKTSFYLNKLPDPDFSIDVGNHKVLANLDEFGKIKQISFYRETYLTEDKPGTWVSNGFVNEKDIELDLKKVGQSEPLNTNNHIVKFDLLFNNLPRFKHCYADFEVDVLFIPLVDERQDSISGIVQVIKVKDTKEIEIEFPCPYLHKYSDRHDIQIQTIENKKSTNGVGWCLISDPNAGFDKDDFEVEDLIWNSFKYYKNYLGRLEIPELPELGALIQRTALNALNSISCDTAGTVVGANWGSAPVTNRTWMRDMFYSSLPALQFDPRLIEKTISWFSKYEVKKYGAKFKGGLKHSVVNALNSTILMGFYIKIWGNTDFVLKNTLFWNETLKKVDTLIGAIDKKDGLIESEWISDGIAVGQYHTGTQIVLWRAIKNIEEIFKSVFKDTKCAEKYAKIAQKLKANITNKCTAEVDGQRTYLEGCNLKNHDNFIDSDLYEKEIRDQGLIFLTRVNDGKRINLHFHDGEESDLTLTPVYQFHETKDTLYEDSMKFAGMDNPTYSPLSKGISWGEESESTFPGFITILMGHLQSKDDFKKQIIHLLEITDLDGSWWWWPYKTGHDSNDVVRFNSCGKCGWASGTFNALATTSMLGIEIDAVTSKLTINLDQVTPSYTWNDYPTCFGRLSIKVDRQSECDKLIVKRSTNLDEMLKIEFIRKKQVKEKLMNVNQQKIELILED